MLYVGDVLRPTSSLDVVCSNMHRLSLDSLGRVKCLRLGDTHVPRVSDLLPAIAATIPRHCP